MTDRWRVGTKLGRTICRNERLVGMVDTVELATEIVSALNKEAPNDREGIACALTREANRIFHTQEKDYPSNMLDRIANNIRLGHNENLTGDPWKK
jgi:hypothetical protein